MHTFFSANNCDTSTHQCRPLSECSYFGNILSNGGSSSAISAELSKLFCGHDGLGVLVKFYNFFLLLPFNAKITTNMQFISQICCPSSSSSPITGVVADTQLTNQGYANSDGIIFSGLGSYGPNNYQINPLNQMPMYTNMAAINPSIQAALNEHTIGLDQPNQLIPPYPSTLDPEQTDVTTQNPYLINASISMGQSSDNVQVPDASNNVFNFAGQLPFNIQTASNTFLDQNTQQWQNIQSSPPSLSATSLTFTPLLAIPSLVSVTQFESNHLANKIPAIQEKPAYPNIGSYNNKQKTPNHCGVSNFTYSTRVVGGQVAESGK